MNYTPFTPRPAVAVKEEQKKSSPRNVSPVTSNTVAMLGVVGEAGLTDHLIDTSNTRY